MVFVSLFLFREDRLLSRFAYHYQKNCRNNFGDLDKFDNILIERLSHREDACVPAVDTLQADYAYATISSFEAGPDLFVGLYCNFRTT